jgi:BirA family biotin operon repressor/biotin-[acetyl-CoA-carboxylase] ligase
VTFGLPRRHLRRCESTNTIARELAADGAPGGTVITADEQTAGRGRQGRSWVAPPGGALLYSAILRPLDRRHVLLPLAAPLAVADAVERLGEDEVTVKWPNDIWLGGRKVAGILIEARPQDGWAVIGIGVNVSIEPEELPAELRDTATSIGRGATVEEAALALDEALTAWVGAKPDAVLEGFRSRDALRGREVSWSDGEGVADGIDDDGNLLVLRPDGDRVALGAGEVHLRL